jgi:hypothetical protein
MSATSKPVRDLGVDPDDAHASEIDGFVAQNREPLKASIRRARDDLARGQVSRRSVEDVIAAGRKRNGVG